MTFKTINTQGSEEVQSIPLPPPQEITIKGINWKNLLTTLDDADTLIIKSIYHPISKILPFTQLFNKLNLNRNRPLLCKTTLRDRLNMLEKEGLIQQIRTKPLIINPIVDINLDKVKELIKWLSGKHRLESIE